MKTKKMLLGVLPLLLLASFLLLKRDNVSYFSPSSLEELKHLNGQYGMVMDNLLGADSEPLQKELLYANTLLENKISPRKFKGLIAYSAQKNNFFLLQPQKQLSDDQLRLLSSVYQTAIPEFHSVEIDQPVTLETDEDNTQMTQADVSTSQAQETPLSNVRVAILDSGLDRNHEFFKDKKIEEGWNALSGDSTIDDDIGHGTHVAGIILSQNPQITLIPYKIIDSQGGKLSDVIKALSKAIEDKANIINMSFGFTSSSSALQAVIDEATQKNIFIVAAAGNNSDSLPFYPAYYPSVIAVAAVDDDYQKMPHSDYGNWVDVAAYGYRVLSTVPHNTYGRKSGTSQAAGFVTATVADIISKPHTNGWQLQDVEQEIAKRTPLRGQDELMNVPILEEQQ